MPANGAKGSILSPLIDPPDSGDIRAPKPRLKPRKSIMLGDVRTLPSEGSFASFTEESRRPRVCCTPINYGV